MLTVEKDGTATITDSKGKTKKYKVPHETLEDGTIVYKLDDGTSIQKQPDGTYRVNHDDGSVTVVNINGTIIRIDPDG